MDLTQTKLIKSEWESIEIPINKNETTILKMIQTAYDDVNYSYNYNSSLIDIIKLHIDKKQLIHNYIFTKYFKTIVKLLIKKYKIDYSIPTFKSKEINIKREDIIRIEHTDPKLHLIKNTIYEFEIIDIIESLLKSYKKNKDILYYYYYTLYHIRNVRINHINIHIMHFAQYIITHFENNISTQKMIYNSYNYIEKNPILLKYKDIELYDHQKKLFTVVKQKTPKLVLYQAPTGTGKTMSPIGLVKDHKIIFVCAAKHVGLQLAKSCVSMDIPLAIGFGCDDPGDIRLHYNAAKDIVKNYKTGGIFRVDNSVGDKVQLMVCDVRSYLPAMNYMCAFNKPEDIITYWDEPTISLDYDEHPFHSIIQQNWRENLIPNLVLSSATLPNKDELLPLINKFTMAFDGCIVHDIVSHDCKKTIPIIDVEGNVCLPHTKCATNEELDECLQHCSQYKTLLRHFDLQGIIRFIKYVYKNDLIHKSRYKLDNYFDDFGEINVINIKLYYLELLTLLKQHWSTIYSKYMPYIVPRYKSTIKITTEDAHTLTDGPTIFIANNVENVAKYCLKLCKIPIHNLKAIEQNIAFNSNIISKIQTLNDQLQAYTDKLNKNDDKKYNRDPFVAKIHGQIEGYTKLMKSANLDNTYIPNKIAHLKKYNNFPCTNAFCCDIPDYVVEDIMKTDVSAIWKLLLLLGIGVFMEFKDIKYLEIMKKLAHEQKLFMIIASSDYIYGTNYQFCHGYISKDIIETMTQEKVIQAFGRVGRNNAQQDYSIRIRDNSVIDKIFKKDLNRKEITNMNRLMG
jgi:hypothetical protein